MKSRRASRGASVARGFKASGQKLPAVPVQARGESATAFVQRVYSREGLAKGADDPILQRLQVRVMRADGEYVNYSVYSYFAYVEKKRYKRKRQRGLTLRVGYDLGPGNFHLLRTGREIPLAKLMVKRKKKRGKRKKKRGKR